MDFQSAETKQITKAIIKAQMKIKHAEKDASNPHFRSEYATLESVIDAVKEHLLENEVTIIQSQTPNNTLITRLQHSSGEFFQSEAVLLNNKNDMQGLGSAITYQRRYSIASMLCIAQSDDDGNASLQTKQGPQVMQQNQQRKTAPIQVNKL